MDLTTALALFTALAGSELLKPTSKAVGEKLKDSLENIAQKARLKRSVTQVIGLEPNFRVLKAISNEGAFCNDELMAEYFGGVLASSLSGISRDDRGVSFASLVGRLNTYQIRSHYIFYNTVKELFDGRTDVTVMSSKQIHKLTTFISNKSYNLAMEFDEKEDSSIILPSVMSGLARESLIQEEFEVIGGEKTAYCGGNGIVFSPTPLGVELFLWVHGMNDILVTEFLNKEYQFSFDANVNLPKQIKSVDKILNHYKEIGERIKPEF